MRYNDPSGEFIFTALSAIFCPALLPAAIGADIGMWAGGSMANGTMNPFKWDYSSEKTWGYMAGGAIVGSGSGYLGNIIANSGIPFANAASIAGASLANSLGTWAYTGGQTDISISFGTASFNFKDGSFGYLGKKDNKWYEDLGYGLGAMANVSDVLIGFKPQKVDLVTEKSDAVGHSAIVKHGTRTGSSHNDPNGLISVGPDRINQPNGSWHWMKGTNKWKTYSATGNSRWIQRNPSVCLIFYNIYIVFTFAERVNDKLTSHQFMQ
ncbi:hypothetical protein D0T57_12480, partial [Dysgonomonas sp. 511]|nr:hypothetical protein [Dysgonomonas sp. 511]